MKGKKCGQHSCQETDGLWTNFPAALVLSVWQPAVSLLVQLPLLWVRPELTGQVMSNGQSENTHHRDENAPD
jgi:hypothetical protein